MATFHGRVLVYSIVGCPHCLKAKSALADHDVPFVEVSLDKFNEKVRAQVKALAGGKTSVPQIFFNDVHVGGNDELQKLMADSAAWTAAVDKVRSTPPTESTPNVPDAGDALADVARESTMISSITLAVGQLVCESDEYVRLVNEMKAANLIKDHSKLLRNYKKSFSGADFIDWIVNVKKLDEPRALAMGQELITQHFGHTLKGDEEKFTRDGFYRLIEDDETKALNGGVISECAPVAPSELGEHVRTIILKLYSECISADGRVVDHTAMTSSATWTVYTNLVRQLQRVDVASADRATKLAFFVNIYNALVVHASAVYGVPTSTWQRYKFFNTAAYLIGGHIYSLQDIENGVLRGNRKGVGMLFKSFGEKDARLPIALSPGEPLIHFALNCGAKSCPPIKTFSAKNIDAELRLAAESFLESDDGCTIENEVVHVSQIFKWYMADFGGTPDGILSFIVAHIGKGSKKDKIVACHTTGKCKLKYSAYDWGSNAKK